MAAGDVLALLAEERRCVDSEEHRHGGFVDLDGGQGLGGVGVADGVADFESHVLVEVEQHGAYLAGLHLVLGALLAEAFESVELLDLGLNHRAVALGEGDGLAGLQGAAVQTSHGDAAEVAAIVERADHHLGVALGYDRRGYMLDNEVHKVADVLGGGVPVFAHPALLGAAVGGGELQLVVVGAEVEHEVEHSLLRGLGVAVGFVDLVDHHDRLQSQFDGLLQHEACLGHRTLEGVDHQQDAVGHVEHALHLAAEIAVARSIDDVDFVAFVADADILAEDGDAAFAFEVVVVENQLAGLLVVAEELGLMKHAVDQGGLAVVDVGYDCDISYILHRWDV